MMSVCGSNRLTTFSLAGTVSPANTRRLVGSIRQRRDGVRRGRHLPVQRHAAHQPDVRPAGGDPAGRRQVHHGGARGRELGQPADIAELSRQVAFLNPGTAVVPLEPGQSVVYTASSYKMSG